MVPNMEKYKATCATFREASADDGDPPYLRGPTSSSKIDARMSISPSTMVKVRPLKLHAQPMRIQSNFVLQVGSIGVFPGSMQVADSQDFPPAVLQYFPPLFHTGTLVHQYRPALLAKIKWESSIATLSLITKHRLRFWLHDRRESVILAGVNVLSPRHPSVTGQSVIGSRWLCIHPGQ
jgi:hypothetical protein